MTANRGKGREKNAFPLFGIIPSLPSLSATISLPFLRLYSSLEWTIILEKIQIKEREGISGHLFSIHIFLIHFPVVTANSQVSRFPPRF